MNLRELRLFGFKTFADQTVVSFESGITAIVGPNGSGKSNLVDGIRWVLGEQSSRSLRSQKMEDVIFAGNTKRKPLGMAEVSVTFDNDDGKLPSEYKQVQITRRAYRAGESEYFINRNHVRLRDVIDLLMGTGLGPGSYAIVSQGQIDAILSSKPTERRALFEETAGIARFLARKAEALRRLEGTETNAIRVNDLLAELERRIPELDTQVRRAKRYRKVADRVRDLEILSYLRASESRRAERLSVATELDAVEARRGDAASRAATYGAELAALRYTLYQRELELDEKRAQTQTARDELARIESDAAAARARLEALETQRSATSADQERVVAERAELEAALVSLDERLGPLSAEVERTRDAELEATKAVGEARSQLDTVFGTLRAVEAAAAERAASEAGRQAQMQSAHADIARLEADLQAAAAARERAAAQREESRASFEALERDVDARERALVEHAQAAQDVERAHLAAAERLAELQSAHRATSSEVASHESRLHTIEELEASLEGHVPGTRAVIEAAQRGSLPGIVGVVSSLLRVDERYARALDVAFGAALSNIVTETSEDAERAVAMLRERESGRATFLPLDTLANRTGRDIGNLAGRAGVIGYAHALVDAEPEYRGIVAFLVGRVLVVETLSVGIGLVRKEGFRDSIVTLDGEQIFGGGAITGGRYRRERSILARRAQAQTLRDLVPRLREKLEALERDAESAKRETEGAAQERERVRTAHSQTELALREGRTQLHALATEIERLDGELSAFAERRTQTEHTLADTRSRLAHLERMEHDGPEADAERARLEAEVAALRERIAQADAERAAVASAASSARERLAALSAEREGSATRLRLLDVDHERAAEARAAMERDIAQLRTQGETYAAAQSGAQQRLSEAERELETMRAQREREANRASELESLERAAAAEEREANTAGEGGRRRLAEIDAELGMLVETFAQHPATDEEQADVVARYADESDDVLGELPRLREELARLAANVNLNAEADREELSERERFLREQLDDLSKARDTLLATIKEIEASTQEQFNVTFAQVSAAFSEAFARLFPGGEARMWQTNPDNLSESGIELAVQPPGKRMTALAALSGGERAMTAAALIFALIRVRPSPFYLLDEVDAALDDANVDRFSAMVRELSGEAQIIVVTHNKRTMELGSRMFGVTMAEPGVSSIISAQLDDEAERVPEEPAEPAAAEREEAAVAG